MSENLQDFLYGQDFGQEWLPPNMGEDSDDDFEQAIGKDSGESDSWEDISETERPKKRKRPLGDGVAQEQKAAKPEKKRKQTRDEDENTDEDGETQKPKTTKPKKKKKQATKEDENIDFDLGLNRAIGHMDCQLLADHIAQRTLRFDENLSAIEFEDKRIPVKAFKDTSDWQDLRTTGNLPKFLETYSKSGGKKQASSSAPGRPHTLVVTGAGIRAADLTRALRPMQKKDAAVAKLFAKHIKLKDAINYVKKTRIGLGVGTPARLVDLINDGCLSLDCLERIVIDASHIDQKKRGILDMKDTLYALLQLLNLERLRERYGMAGRFVYDKHQDGVEEKSRNIN